MDQVIVGGLSFNLRKRASLLSAFNERVDLLLIIGANDKFLLKIEIRAQIKE